MLSRLQREGRPVCIRAALFVYLNSAV